LLLHCNLQFTERALIEPAHLLLHCNLQFTERALIQPEHLLLHCNQHFTERALIEPAHLLLHCNLQHLPIPPHENCLNHLLRPNHTRDTGFSYPSEYMVTL